MLGLPIGVKHWKVNGGGGGGCGGMTVDISSDRNTILIPLCLPQLLKKK